MGCIRPADVRNFRVVIRNRADREAQLRIAMRGIDFGNWQYSEKTLASGVGRVVDVNVVGDKSIRRSEERAGELVVLAKWQCLAGSEAAREQSYQVPVYVKFLPSNE